MNELQIRLYEQITDLKSLETDTSTAMSLVVEDLDSIIEEEREKLKKANNHEAVAYFTGRIAMLEELKKGRK